MTAIPVAPQARGLIFDLDGTLADTLPLHYAAWHETFARFGVSCPQSFLDRMTGIPTEETVERFNEEYGAALDPAQFARIKERAAFVRLPAAQPIVPVADLARLYQGRLPLALATGGVRANVDVVLSATALAGLFDAIVTADDPVRPKPAPDIFLEAARRLGIAPQACQVFEDGEMGLAGARRAGMIVTDVRPFLNGEATSG